MKAVAIVGIIILILVDVYICYQVLRAEALGEMHYPPKQEDLSIQRISEQDDKITPNTLPKVSK